MTTNARTHDGTILAFKPFRRGVRPAFAFVAAAFVTMMLAGCGSGASRVGALGKARAGAMATSVSERVEKRLGAARRVEVVVEPAGAEKGGGR